MAAPSVSVIIIFFNEETFLAEAIQSVISQTFDNWELLLVDDGSSDRSPNIATEFVSADPARIRLLRHSDGANRGMSASRNLGLEEAKGEWVSFLDGDDVWKSSKLEQQLGLLETHPGVDVLVSPAQWWYSTIDGTSGEHDFVQDLGCNADAVKDGSDLVIGFLRDEWASICDVVARRSVVSEVGGYEDAFSGMFEDQVFHSKLLIDRPVLVTDTWWYRYRQHSATSTSQAHQAGQHRRARVRFLTWLQRYLKTENGVITWLRAEVIVRLLAARFPLVRLARRGARATLRRLRADLTSRRQTAP